MKESETQWEAAAASFEHLLPELTEAATYYILELGHQTEIAQAKYANSKDQNDDIALESLLHNVHRGITIFEEMYHTALKDIKSGNPQRMVKLYEAVVNHYQQPEEQRDKFLMHTYGAADHDKLSDWKKELTTFGFLPQTTP